MRLRPHDNARWCLRLPFSTTRPRRGTRRKQREEAPRSMARPGAPESALAMALRRPTGGPPRWGEAVRLLVRRWPGRISIGNSVGVAGVQALVRCLASIGERASARPPPRRCASRAVRPAVRPGDPGPAGAGGDRGVAAVGPPRTPNVPAWSGGVGEAHPQGGVGAAASGSTSKICCRRTAHRRVASVGATRGAGMIMGGASTAAGSACRRIPRGRLAYQP